ncbi:hypothetical protein BDU57DRAFT_340029 [Ampelomyces quisqualis]|uniref:Uncharacterized protein n=1 Tax=Ampelomyces quisqualis TaxID=50730 RepID=A0A6A5QBG1_AMPQU|nr:hypothetical protein BDU57DRAFT_340029 [Ampelomyces quisqualis]
MASLLTTSETKYGHVLALRGDGHWDGLCPNNEQGGCEDKGHAQNINGVRITRLLYVFLRPHRRSSINNALLVRHHRPGSGCAAAFACLSAHNPRIRDVTRSLLATPWENAMHFQIPMQIVHVELKNSHTDNKRHTPRLVPEASQQVLVDEAIPFGIRARRCTFSRVNECVRGTLYLLYWGSQHCRDSTKTVL